jgi:hypothetical protein
MSTKRISGKMAVALILCLGLLGSISSCGGSSTTIIFIPSQVTAQFAVFSDATEATSGTTSAVYAGAIFWQGLITREVVDGLVEIVEPGGTKIPLNLAYNPAGAPYYIVQLASLQLNQQYTFRVTLSDGSILENSITTPADSLAITSPTPAGVTLALNDWLAVEWTNSNAGRDAAIVLRRESTAPFFSVVGAGRVQTPDDGSFDGMPPPVPGTTVQYAMVAGDVGTTGIRYLTVTRSNASGVNGFLAASFIQASLVYALEVQITPTL